MDYQTCDNCQGDIPIANYGLHVVTCRRHTYRCERCGECVAVSGREEHEQLRHTQEQCSLCGDSFLKADTAAHLLECEYANELCEFCDSEVRRREMAEHRDACGSRTERCHTCSRYVLLRHKDTHTCQVAADYQSDGRVSYFDTSDYIHTLFPSLRISNPSIDSNRFHTWNVFSSGLNTFGSSSSRHSDGVIPCEFCSQLFALTDISSHQLTCQQS